MSIEDLYAEDGFGGPTQLTRRGLLVKSGLAAAGVTMLGAPAAAFAGTAGTDATIKVAIVTHGDTGSFWSVFKKGVDQAAKDMKSRGISVTQVYANNDVAKQVTGINAAIAARAKVIATSVPDASALKDPLDEGGREGHRDHHRQLGPRRVRRPVDLQGARRPDRGHRRSGRRQAVQEGGRQEGADRDPRGQQLGPPAARRRRQEDHRQLAA